jgi:hypothetical protein
LFEFFTKLYKTDDIAKGFLYLSLVRILSKLSGKKESFVYRHLTVVFAKAMLLPSKIYSFDV